MSVPVCGGLDGSADDSAHIDRQQHEEQTDDETVDDDDRRAETMTGPGEAPDAEHVGRDCDQSNGDAEPWSHAFGDPDYRNDEGEQDVGDETTDPGDDYCPVEGALRLGLGDRSALGVRYSMCGLIHEETLLLATTMKIITRPTARCENEDAGSMPWLPRGLRAAPVPHLLGSGYSGLASADDMAEDLTLEELNQQLASVQDQLLGLDPSDFAEKHRLKTEQDHLRRVAGKFRQERDLKRSDKDLLAELRSREASLDEFRKKMPEPAQAVSAGSDAGAWNGPADFMKLNEAMRPSSGIGAQMLRISQLLGILKDRGVL